MVTILATTALRIGEVSGLRVGDIDLIRGLIHVLRQTYPAAVVWSRRRPRAGAAEVQIIDPLRPPMFG